MTEITLGGVPLVTPATSDARLALLLWGDAGCGKTTLAMTAPGTKLVIQFDPDGVMSVTQRNDVLLLNLSIEPYRRVIEKFRADDPYGLEAYLKEHENVETVVFDSATAFSYMALREAVAKTVTAQNKVTMEQPSMAGYAWRNAVVTRVTHVMLELTGRLGRNLIVTTHEGTPDKDDKTGAVSITMALAKNTANQMSLRFNEVWRMEDDGKQHNIYVRPSHGRSPMKTRMWDATKSMHFAWRFDPITQRGDGLATWLAAWREAGGKKLPMPK